ncbi:UPF0164 family protein, partial [bacterium]|nr:UPF0164 family protein [bacterium]
MKYLTYIILSVLLSLQPLLAGAGNDISKTGMSAASFLEIGVGARALGMGGAFVGIADDASALYWNPGGLPEIPRPEFIFMHSEWLADMDYDYLGLVLPLGGAGSFGLSLS